MVKIKIIHDLESEKVEKRINEFIKDKEIINIEYFMTGGMYAIIAYNLKGC